MVALSLQKYADDLPQIGKVVNLTDMDVTVEWWIGSYSSAWEQDGDIYTKCNYPQ